MLFRTTLQQVLASRAFVLTAAPFSPTRTDRPAKLRAGLKGAVCYGKHGEASTAT
jgi:hypothetical protein